MFKRLFKHAQTLASAGLACTFLSIPAFALPISSTDLWNFNNGSTVTSHSGTCCGSSITSMFGGTGAGHGDTLFQDFQPAGTVHWVQWQTTSAMTLRSIVLNAIHDGPPRDANARGISEFRLFAYNMLTSVYDLILSYSPSNPYDQSVAPANGIVEASINGSSDQPNYLSLGVNLNPVTTDRFRAEFVQFGTYFGNANGPRISELDGFDTFLSEASDPTAVPVPAALPLLAGGLGLFGLMGWRRSQKTPA